MATPPPDDSHGLRHLAALQAGATRMLAAQPVAINPTPRTCIMEEGLARLYRYAPKSIGAKAKRQHHPLLIVYALVNRPGMLDLQPDRSFIRRLLEAGITVHLIDWSPPTRANQCYRLADYLLGDLHACVQYLRNQTTTGKLHLAGVCQGGTFATTYAARFPEQIQTLTTLVTPIDFDAGDGLLFQWAKQINAAKIARTFQLVPASFMMAGFEQMRPFQRVLKYVDMARWADAEDRLQNFLRLEQWLYQCPDLAGPAFEETITWFFQQNRLLKGTLQLDGYPIALNNITCPLLNVYAEADHIVPPATSLPLAAATASPDTTELAFPGGHIGVFVSSRTQRELAPAVADWLLARDSPKTKR